MTSMLQEVGTTSMGKRYASSPPARIERLSGVGARAIIVAALGATAWWATARARAEQQLRVVLALERARHRVALDAANTCPITGLLLRQAWRAHAEAAFTNGTAVEIAFLDLDGFKDVNDTHGHDAGDTLLSTTAHRLRRHLPYDLLGRAGGDEFVAVTRRPTNWTTVDTELREPMHIHGTQIAIRASIGVAPTDDTLTNVLHHADSAMYHAKQAGGGVRKVGAAKHPIGTPRHREQPPSITAHKHHTNLRPRTAPTPTHQNG